MRNLGLRLFGELRQLVNLFDADGDGVVLRVIDFGKRCGLIGRRASKTAGEAKAEAVVAHSSVIAFKTNNNKRRVNPPASGASSRDRR